MEWEPELTTEALEVERHRPERSWDAAVVAGVCCSCCCCCCCCAHAVGATAGAVAGSVGSLAKHAKNPEARRGAFMAIVAYWGAVAVVSFLSMVLALLVDETLIALIVLAIVAPMLQVVGSFVALPTILFQRTPDARKAAAGAVGSMTVGWLAGGLIGGVLIAGVIFLLGLGAGALS